MTLEARKLFSIGSVFRLFPTKVARVMIIATMANPALTDTPGYAFKFNIGKIVQFTTEQQCTYTVGQERKLLCEIKFLI